MKITPLLNIKSFLSVAVLTLIISLSSLSAETLFKENFDDLPYVNQKGIPTGLNQIDFGRWEVSLDEGSSALITQEQALSAPQSVVLYKGGASERSGLIAVFGETASQRGVSHALNARLSFLVTGDNVSEVYIYSAEGGGVLSYAQIVAQEGQWYVRGWFDGAASEQHFPISPGVWYTLEFRLPENPGPESEYELRMWESEQPEPTEPLAKGKFYFPPPEPTAYRLLTVSNQRNDSSIYLDDFLVETVAP